LQYPDLPVVSAFQPYHHQPMAKVSLDEAVLLDPFLCRCRTIEMSFLYQMNLMRRATVISMIQSLQFDADSLELAMHRIGLH
jgi:hypothetical protein